jgi:hypothetical protein
MPRIASHFAKRFGTGAEQETVEDPFVEVTELQAGHFSVSAAGSVESHEQGAMEGGTGRMDQTRDLLLAGWLLFG